MKFNYDFPYNFFDLRNEEKKYLNTNIDAAKLELFISIDPIEFDNVNEFAEIVLEVENTQTFYRKMFKILDNESMFNIPLEEIGSKAMYVLILVAKQNAEIEINGNKDYYELGDCFGLLEKNVINIEQDEGFSGLIKIGQTDKDTIAYDLTADWMTIELPKKTFEKFYSWQKDEETIPFALASLGYGCIQFAIIQALVNPQFKDHKWWQIIESLLDGEGYVTDELDVDDVPGATNKILGNCIQSMVDAALPDTDITDTSIVA